VVAVTVLAAPVPDPLARAQSPGTSPSRAAGAASPGRGQTPPIHGESALTAGAARAEDHAGVAERHAAARARLEPAYLALAEVAGNPGAAAVLAHRGDTYRREAAARRRQGGILARRAELLRGRNRLPEAVDAYDQAAEALRAGVGAYGRAEQDYWALSEVGALVARNRSLLDALDGAGLRGPAAKIAAAIPVARVGVALRGYAGRLQADAASEREGALGELAVAYQAATHLLLRTADQAPVSPEQMLREFRIVQSAVRTRSDLVSIADQRAAKLLQAHRSRPTSDLVTALEEVDRRGAAYEHGLLLRRMSLSRQVGSVPETVLPTSVLLHEREVVDSWLRVARQSRQNNRQNLTEIQRRMPRDNGAVRGPDSR
jgi:hypothetical protein